MTHRYSMGQITSGRARAEKSKRSVVRASAQAHRATADSWTTVKSITSHPRPSRATAMMLAAQKTDPSRVNPSPAEMVSAPVRETKPTPVIHSRAAATL